MQGTPSIAGTTGLESCCGLAPGRSRSGRRHRRHGASERSNEVRALARANTDVAKRMIADLLPFWTNVVPHEKSPGLADQVLGVANTIGDTDIASALVEPIRIEQIAPKLATHWIDLVAVVWVEVVRSSVRALDVAGRPSLRVQAPHHLARLVAVRCAPLCTRGGADVVELVRHIVRAQWTWLSARLDTWTKSPVSSYSLKDIDTASRPIVAVLAAAALADDRDLQSTIVERLMTKRGYPIAAAVAILRTGSPHGSVMLGLRTLHEDCMNTLLELVATQPRARGDWSIATQLECKCALVCTPRTVSSRRRRTVSSVSTGHSPRTAARTSIESSPVPSFPSRTLLGELAARTRWY